ncbi:uncharacterized protein N7477_008247 [Penicillium maclennaniae]|uniref:uncharacterized protein n=1 Tax=Penicillium maclennaniae TaxID=1343394 RepID=UPI002540E9F0|nr:uncharacterized protein N7477_008247 [Penicillium maclennaniae]KAJ5665799.1 hypothetical protein N7477_008247 [Penicillium maclennaniae]
MESIMTISLPPEVSYQQHPSDQILAKFKERTAPTVSIGKRLAIYQNEVTKLAPCHPFLMHAIATLTLMHDRHLIMADTPIYNSKLTPAESYQWYRAASSFNDRLSSLQRCRAGESIPASTQLALLSTAAILWAISFYYTAARSPEEAWPLKSPSSSDLNWLRMNNGKEQIWKVTQSYPPDPMSMALASIQTHEMLPAPNLNIDALLGNLPPAFIRLFNLDDRDLRLGISEDPYYTIGVQLGQVAYKECPLHVSVLGFISFISGMSPLVRGLLEAKDPRLLLALALWYAKLYHIGIWWMSRRLLLEGQAICTYLERFYPHDFDIQTLLESSRITFRTEGF